MRLDGVARRLGLLRRHAHLDQGLLLLQILAFEAVVPFLFRLPLPRVEHLLTSDGRGGRRRLDPADAAGLVDAGMQIGRPLVRPGCLTRSACLYWLLRRHGYDVRLVFGVGEIDGQLSGHAWLIHDDEPFLEKRDPRPAFEPIWAFGRR